MNIDLQALTPRRVLVLLLIFSVLIFLPILGCSTIVEDLADHMTVKSLKHQHDIALFEGDIAAFQTCLHTRGGDAGSCKASSALTALLHSTTATGEPGDDASIPPATAALHPVVQASIDQLPAHHPAKHAADALSHPALQNAVDLHNHLRGHGSGKLKVDEGKEGECDRIHMPVSVKATHDLSDKISSVTSSGGWDALQQHVKGVLAATRKDHPDHPKVIAEARKAQFVKAYVEAYFDNGHFLNVDFQIQASEAEADIGAFLAKHHPESCTSYNARGAAGSATASAAAPAPDTSCSALAQTIYKAAGSSSGSNLNRVILQAKPTGYISRDASTTSSRNQFPTFGVTFDPLAHHLVTVTGPQGKADYTQIGNDLLRIVLEAVFDHHEALPVTANSTAASLEPPLPIMPIGNISAADIARMAELNTRASSAAGVVVNRLVEGIGPLSLNNEAIEDLITTTVTTSVYKAVEKVTWCWYACNLDSDVHTLAEDAKDVLKAKEKEFVERLKHARHASKRTCLALHVSE